MAKRPRKRVTYSSPREPRPPFRFTRDWLWGLLLVGAIVLTYLRVWQAGYVWDDGMLLTANPCVVGPQGLKEIWTTSAADICPLTITTFWAFYHVWGDWPLPYHLLTVLLHAAGAIVLWRVLLKLGIPGAWLGAALWTLHPVQVESVAWISETKNTQSGLFFLLAIFFYLRELQGPPRRWNYPLTLLFGALAMASKSSTVVLPVVLGFCAWWIEGKWNGRRFAQLVPFFFFGLVAGGVSIATQRELGSDSAEFNLTWPEKLCGSGQAIWFYLGKLIWPHPLVAIYPHRPLNASHAISYLPVLAVLMTGVVLWRYRKTWARGPFFALGLFFIAVSPALGFVNNTFFRYSPVADHFQYLASMGPLALVAAAGARLAVLRPPRLAWMVPATLLLLVCAFISFHRSRVYRDQTVLWTDTLAKNPASWVGHNNLGTLRFLDGRLDDAIAEYHTALQILPAYPDAHSNLGYLYLQMGRIGDAIAEVRQAVAISPRTSNFHNDLGNALMRNEDVDGAEAEYKKALALNPLYADAENNLAAVCLKKGRADEAFAHFERALALNPRYADAHVNFAGTLVRAGRLSEAIDHYQTALEINPELVQARNDFATALLENGSVEESIAQYQLAVQAEPKNRVFHYNLGNALFRKGDSEEAIAEFHQALALDPKYTEAAYNLANALYQKGDLDGAIAQDQTVLAIDPKQLQALNNLGVFLLQKGRAREAVACFQKALELNPGAANLLTNLTQAKAAVAAQHK